FSSFLPEHHPSQIFEIDLVDDTGIRRNDGEVTKSSLPPAQECIAFAIALEFKVRIYLKRGLGAKLIDLNRMVNHQFRRLYRIDQARIAAQVRHRIPHGCKVNNRRNSRELLHEHAAGSK